MVSRPAPSAWPIGLLTISCAACASTPPAAIAIPLTISIAPPIETAPPPPTRQKVGPRVDAGLLRWEGTFFDPATVYKTFVTIAIKDGIPTVVHAEESIGDKELYEVRSSSWDGTALTWSHFVPSTNYTVTYVCGEARGDLLVCTWKNDRNASGSEDLPRVGATPPDDDDD